MSDDMTDDEIEKLADAIVQKRGGFHVDPEDHYNQHQRLDDMLDLYDSVSNVILKFFVGAVIVGLIAASAIGLGWTK